jgi:hypothetical protein
MSTGKPSVAIDSPIALQDTAGTHGIQPVNDPEKGLNITSVSKNESDQLLVCLDPSSHV